MINKKIFIFFFILITFYFIYPEKLQFNVKLGYGGYSVPGYWIPLYIKINQDVKAGRIEIQRKNNSINFIKEIFPCKKNNTIEYPVLFDENITDIIIRLFSDNELLIEKSIKIDEKIFPGHIILTNGMNSKIQQSIAHSLFPEEPIHVVSINLEDLSSVGLNYDCVSVIVISDPGIILTPAQISALKYWIAGGGQLVIFNLLPESDSIISKLDGVAISNNNFITINSGYGKIFVFHEDTMNSDFAYKSSEWKKLLKLKPYVNNPRLRPAKILKFQQHITSQKNNNSSLKKILLICIISWAGIFFILLFLTKKNLLILSILTIITIIIFIPFGYSIKKIWQGGAVYHNRMIMLPGNNGFLLNSKIWFPSAFNNDLYLRNVPLYLGVSEKILLKPQKNRSSIFIHNITKPEYSLQNNIYKIMDIVSYHPFNTIKDKFLKNLLLENNFNDFYDIKGINFQNKENLVLITGKNRDIEWWTWDIMNYKWKKEKSNPGWLNNDLEWIIQLKKNQLNTDWLICYDNLNEINIKLQGEICSRILWVLPVKI